MNQINVKVDGVLYENIIGYMKLERNVMYVLNMKTGDLDTHAVENEYLNLGEFFFIKDKPIYLYRKKKIMPNNVYRFFSFSFKDKNFAKNLANKYYFGTVRFK